MNWLLQNKYIRAALIVVAVFVVCAVAKISFSFTVGPYHIGGGFDRTPWMDAPQSKEKK